MPRVGSEPKIPMFERAKTVHALDRAATAIVRQSVTRIKLVSLLYLLSVSIFEVLKYGRLRLTGQVRHRKNQTCTEDVIMLLVI
jgi:hypothetical protein